MGARALAVLGDSVTTDHISPAGSIAAWSPAGQWLQAHGVAPLDFNSYGARRGHHEVMMRGTFGNIRLRNRLVEGKEGPYTVHLPDGEQAFIYDAAMRYRDEGVPLVIIAGKEYGSGSSRDWAAKGTTLLGVRAVIAESYERIHRSNLVGMGVLPLQFLPGESAASLGLTGRESFTISRHGGPGPAPGGDGPSPGPTRTGRSGRSGPSPAWTARSRWSTCARAASCRRSCGGSRRTEPGGSPGRTRRFRSGTSRGPPRKSGGLTLTVPRCAGRRSRARRWARSVLGRRDSRAL